MRFPLHTSPNALPHSSNSTITVTVASVGSAASNYSAFKIFKDSATRARKARTGLVMTGHAGSRDILPRPLTPESAWDRLNRSCSNFFRATGGSVSNNTEAGYCTAVNQYRLFCEEAGIADILLRQPAPGVPESHLPYAVIILGAFLVFLVSDHGIQGDSACGYLSGLRHFFQVRQIDTSPFDHPSITDARAHVRAIDVAKASRLSRRRIPFTHEMLRNLRLYVCAWDSPRGRCCIVATVIGLTLCMRCSEILFSIEDHYLRGMDVVFSVCEPSGVTVFITSVDAHKFTHCTVTEMFVLVRSAKNDQEGEGHDYTFLPSVLSSTCAFCIVSDMWSYAVMSRLLHEESPFFSYPHGDNPFILQYQYFKKNLKDAARRTIGSDAKIGTQSLRISGATILDSAGTDKLSIRDHMRSKSTSFLRYVRHSRERHDSARAAIANPTLFTTSDLGFFAAPSLVRK